MESESVAARRRVNVISSHFIPYDASTTPTNFLFPMNCSASLNTVVQRRDNKTYFARQGSGSQACFMRPVSVEQDGSGQDSLQKPLFSRPTSFVPKIPKAVDAAAAGDSKLSAAEPPQFSRANGRINEEKRLGSMTNIHALSSGSHWTPKLDVAESGRNFVLTVELPGVDVNDIRVEVNDKALTIKGNRRCQCERVKTGPHNTILYHRREILQGPYQVVWSFPPNLDKESVSAAFVDGFLRITIPRL